MVRERGRQPERRSTPTTTTRRTVLTGLGGLAAMLALGACGGSGAIGTSGSTIAGSAVRSSSVSAAGSSPGATSNSAATTSSGARTTSALATTAGAKASTAPAVVSGPGTLQLFTASKGRADWLTAVAKLKTQEQGQPVQIDAQVLGGWGDVTDKVQAIVAGGAQPPDLAAVEISQFPRWIRPGQKPPFLPLDAPLGDRKKDLFAPSATDPWSWEGRVYGLGNELNASLLSYRTDLFQHAGVDPASMVHWPDILDVGRKVKTVASAGLAYWGSGDLLFLAMQAGGGLFDAQGKPVLNQPANLKALEFMQQAMVKDQVVALDPGATKHYAQITQGAYAAITGPAWKFSGQIRANAPDTSGTWHVEALPTWDLSGSHASWSQGGTALVAPVGGKQTQAAVDFILYAHTTTKAVLLDYEGRNTYPTWRPAFDDPALQEKVAFFGGQVVATPIKQAANDMAPFFTSPLYPKVNPLLSQAAQAVIDGKQQPADALAAAQQQAEGIAASS